MTGHSIGKRKPHSKRISAQRVIVTSFVVDLLDILINVLVTVFSGSVVMLSQALEGSADLVASAFLLIGIRRAGLQADKRHPLGYGRELYFWTFLSALVIFIFTAGASFYFGLRRFLNPEPVENLTWAYLALTVAIGTNGYAMGLSVRRLLGKKSLSEVGRVFRHSTLIETKASLVLDLMGTTASIIGLGALFLYRQTRDWRYDGLGAMAVGLALAVLASFVLKGAKDLLVGRSADPEVEKKIIRKTEAFSGIRQVLDLRTLHIGPEKMLVDMEVHVDHKLTAKEVELLIDEIKAAIKKAIPLATHIQIELETPEK